MYADFLGIEAGMGPLFSLVFPLELGQGTGPTYRYVIGVEVSVDHQLPIIHQARVIDSWNI